MAASAADIASDITQDLPSAGSRFPRGHGERLTLHPVRSLADLFAATRQLPWRITLLSTAPGMLDLAFPLVLFLVLEHAGNDQTFYTLPALAAGLLCVVAAGMLLRRTRNRLLADFAARENFRLQTHAAHCLLNAAGPTAVRLSASAVSDAFRSVDELSQYNGDQTRLAAVELPFVALYLMTIGIIGGMIVALPIVLTVLFIVWILQARAAMQPFAFEAAEHDRGRFDFYAESIGALATVKALAVEPRLQQRHESRIRHAAAAIEAVILQKMHLNDFGNLFETVMFLPVAAAACLMAAEGVLSIGAAASCSLIAILIARSTRRIVSGMDQARHAEMALVRAKAVLDLPQHGPKPSGQTEPAKVQLNGVRMNESGAPPERNRGVNLTIRPGETIELIIRDENRRRMMADILSGRIDPDHGECLIDGWKVSAQPAALPRVMFVDDEPAIFHGTIMENISMFGAMNPATAIEMARRLEVEPGILRLPEGYHTMLTGETTTHLSRDMLHAITLARAAAIRPGLLVLDIPRSMLSGIAGRAYGKMIGELRGSVTIVALGRAPIDAISDARSYWMKGWSLEPVDAVVHTGDDSPEEPGAAHDD